MGRKRILLSVIMTFIFCVYFTIAFKYSFKEIQLGNKGTGVATMLVFIVIAVVLTIFIDLIRNKKI